MSLRGAEVGDWPPFLLSFDRDSRRRERRGPDLELAFAKGGLKGGDDDGIEFGFRSLDYDVAGIERRHRLAIRAIACQRVVDIGDRDDAGFQRNLLTARRMVAGPVELIVVREDDGDDATERAADRFQEVDAPGNVFL